MGLKTKDKTEHTGDGWQLSSFVFAILGGAEDWSQGLVHAWQSITKLHP